MPDITATPADATERRSADGITEWDARRVDVYIPNGIDGATSARLPDGRVVTVVVQSAENAEALAAARIERGDRDLLADTCRPVAQAVAAALVAAGMGRG